MIPRFLLPSDLVFFLFIAPFPAPSSSFINLSVGSPSIPSIPFLPPFFALFIPRRCTAVYSGPRRDAHDAMWWGWGVVLVWFDALRVGSVDWSMDGSIAVETNGSVTAEEVVVTALKASVFCVW